MSCYFLGNDVDVSDLSTANILDELSQAIREGFGVLMR